MAHLLTRPDYLREMFLRRIAKIAQGVLADLKDNVWPEYCRATPELRISSYDRLWHPAHFPTSAWPQSLTRAVLEWSQRHHLTGNDGRTPRWILEQLAYTLACWGAHPEALDLPKLYWWGYGWWRFEKIEPKPEPLEIFENPNQPPLKKERFKRDEKHFDWAVRYQVLGEEVVDIEQATGADVSTINRAITGLLNEIGLVRRPPAQLGRPGL